MALRKLVLSHTVIGTVEAPIIRSLNSNSASALCRNIAFAVHRLWLAEFEPKVLQCASATTFNSPIRAP
jgi:hypothetical protein